MNSTPPSIRRTTKLRDSRRQRTLSGKKTMNEPKTLSAERGGCSLQRPCSAVFESEYLMAITSPCGHTVPIERAMEGTDRYCCPVCGMRYHVEQDPPKVYPSGFVMPGNRHVVIESQSNLPLCPPNAAGEPQTPAEQPER